ncbi:MAG TPA: hypothetical protein VE173_15820 [Longimicrobiales bacterium]|nr:hypothetical protein [Longimicrobiales bacterium]
MKRARWGLLALALTVAATACGDDPIVVDGGDPAAPRSLDAYYYDRAVYVTWDLASAWNGESFRVYSRRTTDPDYFLIAEVTNCSAGLCSYTDTNIVPDVTYEYYVTAVDPDTGVETATEYSVTVFVPQPVPPPVPGGLQVIALDGAAYLRWDPNARQADDFSFYRVYLEAEEGSIFYLGETDSEGFLDELAENGLTYTYRVSSVDDQGHESDYGGGASATPRPDFHNEWMWDYFDRPELSGFRFQADEATDPLVGGDSQARHFRLETDAQGWWLVPGPDAEIYPSGFETTALKCGPGSDAGCVALEEAPTTGYERNDVGVLPQTTYVLRVRGDDGALHYGSIRVTLLGFDQNDDAIMIFDWAYQLQAGNPGLTPRATAPLRRRTGGR